MGMLSGPIGFGSYFVPHKIPGESTNSSNNYVHTYTCMAFMHQGMIISCDRKSMQLLIWTVTFGIA